MKHFYSYAAFAVMLVAVSIPVLAQPVITYEQRQDMLLADQLWSYYASDANGNVFDLGEPGGENLYDITEYHYGENLVSNSLKPASESPYASYFPDATHVEMSQDQNGTYHAYYILNESGTYEDGLVMVISGQVIPMDFGDPIADELYPMEYPEDRSQQTPMITVIPGSLWQGIEQSVSCDRYGTLRTIRGDHPCLVFRKEIKYTNRVSQGGQMMEAYSRQIFYQFISADGIVANMYIDTLTEGSNTPTMLGLFISSIDELVSTGTVPEIPATTDVFVYPNPAAAGSISTFKWEQESAGFISLALYDMTGRIVREIHEGDYPAGIHSIRIPLGGVTPGTYIVRLTSGTSTASKLLTIIR